MKNKERNPNPYTEMKITRKEFEDYPEGCFAPRSKTVIKFFIENKDYAFTPKEIYKNIVKKFPTISYNSVVNAMKRLAKLKVLERKRPYYILKEGYDEK